VLPTAGSYVDMFDDDDSVLAEVEHPAYAGIRLRDGRALAWAEYGSPRGVPCLLIPDAGSSRLAPSWLLLDSALPSSIRLLALDRPGVGHSDPVGLGGQDDPAEDLRAMVQTLAVGRVAVIGIGEGADDAIAFADRYPQLVAGVSAVSPRLRPEPRPRRGLRVRRRDRAADAPQSAVAGWTHAIGDDLTSESAWQAGLSRMSAPLRALLADRFQEEDFRAAVAADAAETGRDWSGTSRPQAAQQWTAEPAEVGPRVRVWHGQQEPTPLPSIRETADRCGWQLSTVAAPSAVLGCWPQILSTAAASFTASSAA
jgi:pimeloyl-ACP methyl ester carboxylesterase